MRRPVAANSQGEERSSATSRGTSPARIAAIVALAVAVIALAIVYFNSNGGHQYTFVFQNAGQLVPDNQVMIGGSPVGSVESIDLSDDNLAEVHVEVEQELHEGTTAVIRATSLSGVANHYVSISPGPNSNPALEEGATLGLDTTTTPVDIDQLFNTFPPGVRKGLSEFIKGNAKIFQYQPENAQRAYKYLGPGLNRTGALFSELSSDQRLLERFVVNTSKLTTAISQRGTQLSDAVSHANNAFEAIASQNVALDQSLRELPPVLRQSNTTFVNLRAALDDLEPLVDTAKPATKNLAPFLAELRPVLAKLKPFFHDLRLTVARPGRGNDLAELLQVLPTVHERASRAFSNAEAAIAAFQPNLNFIRAYAPDLLNGLGKVGAAAGYYDGNGHYLRASIAAQNVFKYNSSTGVLEPISKSQQYEPFGSSANVRRPCPGGGTQPAADHSNPFVDPPWTGGLGSSECNPNDAPPGP
jgi:phospholipid/cholesterol/gamma-HCH transport system substrate-binding protein